MRHVASSKFWQVYEQLPPRMQALADKAFALLKADPRHPSLHLKKAERYWSVRIGQKHRALGVQEEEVIVWFWIGAHADYDRWLK